jgi:hypothetical protein
MAANGNLIFQDTNKATFVGANSNVVIDTVHASFGVGVDVNGPTSNLHVVGNAYVTSNLEVGTANLFVDTVNSRVGVGTTDPNTLLELSSATGSATITPTELRLSTTTNAGDWDTTNPWGKISFYSHDTSNGGPQVRGAIGMSVLESFGGYGRLGLFTENSGTLSERVSITHTGNVGIGTTNPQDVTHIWKNGSNDAHGLLIEQNNSGTGSATLKFGVAHASESTAGLSKAGIFFKRAASNGRGDLLFCMDNADDTNDVDTSNHALTIYRDGNVGIGTTSPIAALDIDGGPENDTVPAFSIRGGSYSESDLYVLNTYNDSTVGGVGYAAKVIGVNIKNKVETNNTVQIRSNTGGLTCGSAMYLGSDDAISGVFGILTGDGAVGTTLTEKLTVRASGNVGIGTTIPESTLDVHGTGIHINGTVLRAMSAIGTVASGTYIKLCDFSALPTSTGGVCAIRIRWGTGTGGGTYYYWQGHATGIVGYNTYGDGNGTFNGSPVEPLTLNHHYHYRTVGALSFRIDSDTIGASYGRHSIYMAPNASIDSMSFEVIAMPLRR